MGLAAEGLENEMLRLEPLCADHQEALRESGVGEALWKWMPAIPGGTKFENYFAYLLKLQQGRFVALFVLFRKSDGRFAGIVGFGEIRRLHRGVRNLLAWHPPDMFEPSLFQSAQLALLMRAREWGARRIEWQVNTDNHFILEQIKAVRPKPEAVFRNYERTARGEWTDKAVFSLVGDEIEEAVQRLEALLEVSSPETAPRSTAE